MKLPKILGRVRELAFLYTRGGVAYARMIGVKVGDGCRIYSTRFGTEPFLIEIGDRVTITSGTTFLTHDGSTWLIRDDRGRRYLYRPIKIGNDVFVGCNTTILPGIHIGNRVIVGAGSVITRSIPDGVVVAGNPARYVTSFQDYAERALGEYVSDSDLDMSIPYKKRVSAVIDRTPRPQIAIPRE